MMSQSILEGVGIANVSPNYGHAFD